MKTRSTIVMLSVVGMVVALAGPANAAEIIWTADPFDADADISTEGILVEAYNLANATTAVTVNGVTFAEDTVAGTFFVVGADATNADYYKGDAIGTMSSADAQNLMDSMEYGSGAGNTLARIEGLTIGKVYTVQLVTVADYATHAGYTMDFGHSTPSGDATATWTLTGVDNSSNSPYVITGTFTATETAQDIRVVCRPGTNGSFINAYQVRDVTAPGTLIYGK